MVDRLMNSEVNTRRIQAVETCFGSSGQPLAIPNRVLVGEGVLVKMCRKKPKTRQFFLFDDILVYGNIVISKRKYNTQHIIPLEEIELENLEDDGELRNGWLIKTRSKSFAVYAATVTEKKEWMIHIQRCIQDLLTKGNKQASTEHAPMWVPDSEAPKCMQCNKTQFTVIQRRHHCRQCGKVVCNACSNKRLDIPALSRRPVRVCTQCFAQESSDGASRNASARVAANAANPDSSGEENSDDEEEYGGNNAEKAANNDDVQNSENTDEAEPAKFYGQSENVPS